MAKQIKKTTAKTPEVKAITPPTAFAYLYNPQFHVACLLTISLVFYFNTIFNGYALDDMIVITNNSFTKLGFKGIKDILFNDSFLGFTGMDNQLAGGRYRPLSIVTFAIEYGLFGENTMISHSINVILYAVVNLLLYRFLSKWVFSGQALTAFIATLLFAIHPIHTEVVANIKSRDELMCLLFLILSLQALFTHRFEKKSTLLLIWSGVAFFLSLLSKENSIVFVVAAPMICWFFMNKNAKDSILSGLPLFIGFLVYFVLRLKITGFNIVENKEVLNAPYLYANATQAFATKIAMFNRYWMLLLFPNPMSYDYSFNQIKYVTVTDGQFILALLMNVGLIVYAIMGITKRKLTSFCILFYFMCMSLVTNFVFEVGTPMADRFLFQPSLALAIMLAVLIAKWIGSGAKARPVAPMLVISFITLLAAGSTIARNVDWKNEYNLFTADVKACPNSAKTNNNCGVVLINASEKAKTPEEKTQILNEAVVKINRSLEIHPTYVDAWMNLGVAYSRLEDIDKTEAAWLEGKRQSPNHPKLQQCLKVIGNMFSNKGFKVSQLKQYEQAIHYYEKALQYNCDKPVEAWYNLGGNYLMSGNVQKAKEIWTKVLEMNPNHTEAKKWLQTISQPKGQIQLKDR